MSLAYPKLALPEAPETIALRAVEKILRSDPTLQRVVRQWSTCLGEASDLMRPTFATCPRLAISPTPGPSDWETEGQHRAPMFLNIECAVAGGNVDQLLNYWSAVRSALFPPAASDREAWVRQVAVEAKITKPTLTISGYGMAIENDVIQMLISRGVLKLLLLVTT